MSYLYTIRKRGRARISLDELRRAASRDAELTFAVPVTLGALGEVVHLSWRPPGGATPAILTFRNGTVAAFRPCPATLRKMQCLAKFLDAEVLDERGAALAPPTAMEHLRALLRKWPPALRRN